MSLSVRAVFKPRNDLGRYAEVVVSPAIQAATVECCELIQGIAKAYCPVDTGLLQSRIVYVVVIKAKTIVGTVFVDGVLYAVFVEYGTGQRGAASAGAGEGPYSESWPGMPAQAFMRPAADEGKSQTPDIYRKHLEVAIAA